MRTANVARDDGTLSRADRPSPDHQEILLEFEWVVSPVRGRAAFTAEGPFGAVAFSAGPRPVETGLVITNIEELFFVIAPGERAPTPSTVGHPEWALQRRGRPELAVKRLHYGSPLEILLHLPIGVYGSAVAAFASGLAFVFGAPYRAASAFEEARAKFWRSHLAADHAKQEWVEWKQQQIAESVPFELTRISGAGLPPGGGSRPGGVWSPHPTDFGEEPPRPMAG